MVLPSVGTAYTNRRGSSPPSGSTVQSTIAPMRNIFDRGSYAAVTPSRSVIQSAPSAGLFAHRSVGFLPVRKQMRRFPLAASSYAR